MRFHSQSFLLVCVCWLGWAATAAGQNPANYRTFQVPVVYRLPPGQNGLTESAFQLAVSIRMERYATYSEAIVNIRPTQSTAQNPNPSYVHSYTYQGRQYGNQHLGPAAFVPVRARNLQYELKFSTSSHPLITKSREDGLDNLFGPLDKNLKASEITLYISVVGASFDDTSQIEERIRALTEQAATPAAPQVRSAAATTSAPAITAKAGATVAATGRTTGTSASVSAATSASGASGSATGSGTTTSTTRSTTTAARPPAMTQQQAEQYAKDYLARDAASRQAKYEAADKKLETTAAVLNAATPLVQMLGERADAKHAAAVEAYNWEIEMRANYRQAVEKATEEIQTQEYFDKHFYPRVPQLLTQPAVPWATLLGSPVYAEVFGKNVDYIVEHFKPTYSAKGRIKSDLNSGSGGEIIRTPKEFNAFYARTVGMTYASAPAVKDNSVDFIFDENNIVIGIKQRLNTPSSFNRCCSTPIDEYLKALLQKMGDNYLPIASNIYILKNQFVVVDFEAIYLYDLGVLNGRGSVKLTTTNANNLGVIFATTPAVSSLPKPNQGITSWSKAHPHYVYFDYDNGSVIERVLPSSSGATAGLQAGDVITAIEDIPVANFTQLRLAVTSYGTKGKFGLTYRRAGQEYRTQITPPSQ